MSVNEVECRANGRGAKIGTARGVKQRQRGRAKQEMGDDEAEMVGYSPGKTNDAHERKLWLYFPCCRFARAIRRSLTFLSSRSRPMIAPAWLRIPASLFESCRILSCSNPPTGTPPMRTEGIAVVAVRRARRGVRTRVSAGRKMNSSQLRYQREAMRRAFGM